MNQLKTKIDEVKAKLGISTMELSKRLGKNPYYLYKVLNGVSTERQKELMLELEFVANGGTVMTERELIAILSERLTSAQSANRELCLKLQLAEKNHRQLEEMYNSNWDELQETNKLVASLQEYKRQYRNLVATVIVIGIIVVLGFALWSVV